MDTSCPQFVLPESTVKHRRRPSDDVFREEAELARENRKDSGSHSGSDSGMGFSETASEHNINAVLPTQDDVINDDVMPDDVTNKRSSQVLDPRMYLEASYVQDEPKRKLNPSDYLNESTVSTDQLAKTTRTPENPNVYQNKPGTYRDYPSTSKDNRRKNSKKQHWEILEEPTPVLQSPKEILYAPSLQQAATPQSSEEIQYAPSLQMSADQRRSSFRSSRKLVSNLDAIEPMDNDPSLPSHDPNLIIHDPGTPSYPTNENIKIDSEVFKHFFFEIFRNLK